MRTEKIDVLIDMFNQIPKYIVTDKISIEEWDFQKGVFKGEDGYEMDDFHNTIKIGQKHYPKYDSAHFFKASITVPQSMDNKEIRGRFVIGGESLVKCNGKYVAGCTSRNYMPERADFILGKFPAGTVLNFDIEATVDSMEFCDERLFEGKTSQVCVFEETSLFIIDETVDAYVYDIQVAFDSLEYIKDDYIKSKVYAAIDDSLHVIDYDFDDETVRKSIYEAHTYYQSKISEIQWAPQSKIILTGHSHIDVAWLWRVQESIRKSARTFTNILSLMDKYPELTFSQSQAIISKMVKDNYPDLYELVKEKVKLGKWDICGNTWVEADTNIASGESLIRQVLYGTEFFEKEFGKVSNTYWLPDCFGFSAALPQIIKGCGMENFITSKLTYNDTNKFPYSMFMWEGNDGTKVYAHLMHPGYNNKYNVNELMRVDAEVERKDLLNTSFSMFGYGDGGGGPTIKMMERSRRFNKFPGLPEAKIGHVDDFFETYRGHEDELPVWHGEMYYENHRGTFTSQAFVKKNNRNGEFLLAQNELISSLLNIIDNKEYPKEDIEKSWQILMTNQFHDILPGSSIHEVFDDCKVTYAKFFEIANSTNTSKFNELNKLITYKENTIIVWNLTSSLSNEGICVEVSENKIIKGLPSVYKDGKIYFAPDIEPFSYKIFELIDGELPNTLENCDCSLLENDFLKVKIDEYGRITSVYDKVNNRESIEGLGNILTVSLDKCDHETAWNLELNYQKKMWELKECISKEVIENNSLRKIIRFVKKFNKSLITQDYILYYNSNSIIFDTTIDWHETDKVLKAGFDVAVMNTEATYDIAHGSFKRPTHWNTSFDKTRFEVAAHKWADLSEGDYGCSIINDCKYGYDIHNSHMRITLMRAPTCPDPVGDHGINTFRYEFHPHTGDWRTDTVQKAEVFNNNPVAFYNKNSNQGILSNKNIIDISNKNITLECFKIAQDYHGYIIRFVENYQSRGNCKITLPFNIKTVIETNMIEKNQNEVLHESDSFTFNYRPFEVKTFRIII